MERQYSSYKERYITNKYGVGEIYCDALAASTPVLLLVEFFISFLLLLFLGDEFLSLGDQNKGAMACVPRSVFGQNCHISRKKKIGTRHIEHRFLYVVNI